MDERIDVVSEVCRLLSSGRSNDASSLLKQRYAFEGTKQTPRRYGPMQATRVFVRDGFIDRYSGRRVVFPPALRIISMQLPEEFPFHPNWKMDVTHPAYWDLTATIDHLEAAARGGADDDSNWITTSMARNSAKGNYSLADLGWSLQDPGDLNEWDGLMTWYVDFTDAHPDIVLDGAMRQWRDAVLKVLAHG